jgi:ferritin-like metal-binding protein YciE
MQQACRQLPSVFGPQNNWVWQPESLSQHPDLNIRRRLGCLAAIASKPKEIAFFIERTRQLLLGSPASMLRTNQKKEFNMSVDSIEKLFVEELKDIYSAENQITKALPKMAKASTSQELRAAFENHLEETRNQIKRLDQIFEVLGKSAKGKTCDAMKGLLQEGSQTIEETEEGEVRDAAMISAAQRVEHYEMAAYGTVRTFAELLGQKEAVKLLEETLEEEKKADQKLTSISKTVNAKAQRAA